MNESVTSLPDPFTSSLAGRRLGRYEVLARLASGGMAGVYVARALGVAGFERLFAIKVLHPHLAHEEEFISMFLDEARLAARIRHPNVVPTIDISDTPDSGYFLVMDYIEGDHLGALLQAAFKQGARLPPPVALRVVVDALYGLAAAHNLTDEHGRLLNLVHRDISPHNIMVSTDGVARITDFGVAKAEVRLSTTREGQFKGKLAYMAPEHASNGEADQRSDLFSMAIILWESLTGRRLFRAENHAATLNKICLEPIPMPSSVDPALAPFDPVLEKALARDPADRYQSAEVFAEAIEHQASDLGGLANQRVVAQLVREFAAEKINHDKALIRDAISAIGDAHTVSAEMEAAAAAPVIAAPPPAVSPSSAPPIAVPEPEQAQSRKGIWIATAAIVLLGMGAVAFAMLSGGEDEVTTSPLAAPEPPPPPPEPAPEPSEPAQAAEVQGEPGDEAAEAAGAEGTAEAAEPAPEATPRAPSRPRVRRPTPRQPSARAKPAAPPTSEEARPKPKPAKKKSADDLFLNPYR